MSEYKEIEDLFDIPTKKNDGNDDYDTSGYDSKNKFPLSDDINDINETSEKFVDKVKALPVEIKDVKPVVDTIKVMPEPPMSPGEDPLTVFKKMNNQPKSQTSKSTDDDMFGEWNPEESSKKDIKNVDTVIETPKSTKTSVEILNEVISGKPEIKTQEEKKDVELDTDLLEDDSKQNTQEINHDLNEQSDDVPSGPFEVENEVLIVDGKIQWRFVPPNDKWAIFYARKKDAVITILDMGEGKQIPFKQWMSELKDAHVVMETVWDTKAIYEQMKKIQNWINRVSEISTESSRQYWAADRFLDLLHGVVNRIQSEKPVNRQDGLFFEHMRDFELYVCWLKTVHKVSEQVMKTLEGAKDCLSRQVTIALPNQKEEIERTQSSSVSMVRKANETQSPKHSTPNTTKSSDDFDELDTNVVSPSVSGTTIVEWDEIR